MTIKAMVQSLFGKKSAEANGDSFIRNVDDLFRGMAPGSLRDYGREAGDLWKSSVVFPVINWLGTTFTEAAPMLTRKDKDGKAENLHDHPILELLDEPNPFYGGDALWAATMLSRTVNGNAYWVKERSNSGKVVELWYVPHWSIRPVWDQSDPSVFISGYEETVNGKKKLWAVEDVIHFRAGIDPENTRLGLSPLASLIREVATDNEASAFMFNVLKNHGMAGGIISPDSPDVSMSPDELKAFKEAIEKGTTGDNRGRWLALSMPFRLQLLGATPESMVLDKVRQIPESRVCASLLVSPMVVGLSAGLERSTYSNYKEAKEGAYETCLMPTKKSMGREITKQLLRLDFPSEKWRVSWDYSNVRCLQEDETDRVKRYVMAAGGPIMSVNEARSNIGLDAVEGQDEIRTPGAGGANPFALDAEREGARTNGNGKAHPMRDAFLKEFEYSGR